MLRRVDLTAADLEDYRAALPRAEVDVESVMPGVLEVCRRVREEGEAALLEFSQRFDHVRPATLAVPREVIDAATAGLDPQLRASFEESIRRRRRVCQEVELEEARRSVEVAPGARVSQRIVAVQRVGLYVPGGLAPLASSVIMNVVPAQVAGVGSIAVATPPRADHDGLPHPDVLGLCGLLGIDEVYAVGGAQAVAMFAHGVEGLCRRVDLVTGPGNIHVVAAKRALRGVVGIDSEAGPTEIAVLADDSADPRFVAADLASQAEHDPLAAAVLVTDSPRLADEVDRHLEELVSRARHEERMRTSLTSRQSAAVLVRDIDQGLDVVNAYAAEHLEIQTRRAEQVAARVVNAGAVFVGPWSPVPLGDYSAGSTHVLPTAGAACHSSGLGVRSFMRAVHVIDYDRDALLDIAEGIETFARAEDLPSHAEAIAVRRQS